MRASQPDLFRQVNLLDKMVNEETHDENDIFTKTKIKSGSLSTSKAMTLRASNYKKNYRNSDASGGLAFDTKKTEQRCKKQILNSKSKKPNNKKKMKKEENLNDKSLIDSNSVDFLNYSFQNNQNETSRNSDDPLNNSLNVLRILKDVVAEQENLTENSIQENKLGRKKSVENIKENAKEERAQGSLSTKISEVNLNSTIMTIQEKSITKEEKNIRSSKNIRLYQDHERIQKKKEDLIKEKIQKEKEEFTYTPTISTNSIKINSYSNKPLHLRTEEVFKKRKEEIESIKKVIEQERLMKEENLTFHPKILTKSKNRDPKVYYQDNLEWKAKKQEKLENVIYDLMQKDLKENTFHPEINGFSKTLVSRVKNREKILKNNENNEITKSPPNEKKKSPGMKKFQREKNLNQKENNTKLRISLHEKAKRKSKSRGRSKISQENSASPLKRDEIRINSFRKTKSKVLNKTMDVSKSRSASKSKSKSRSLEKYVKKKNMKSVEFIDEPLKVNSVAYKENMNFIIPLLKKDSKH